ncbi:MAG: tRNA (adenosine(37)-N6)-threonylcarbamoyltransferase complex dimerization subunit type 1 TsaB [Chloroflexi bacterium]|nr:tRNA (adenosine(37)-N6)-threonylcarbamoyltransferase complex dimerization subunit type 1 TsaB [Chloroflexota bacterium]
MRGNEPVILAIDTSTRLVGLALYDGAKVLAESTWESRDFHTVELAPAVEDMLKRAQLSAADLGAVAVAIGPGSFTGLRIGLALAKGLALALCIPLIGVPTLDIVAAAQPLCDLPLAAVLRAGRGRLATGWYENENNKWKLSAKIQVFTAQTLCEKITSPAVVCGELNAAERQVFFETNPHVIVASPAQSLRRPSILAEIGWQRWQANQVDDPASLSPIYLHYNDPIPES